MPLNVFILKEYFNILILVSCVLVNIFIYCKYSTASCDNQYFNTIGKPFISAPIDDNAIFNENPRIIDFEDYDNENDNHTRPLIVPNIVHLIYMNVSSLRFHEMICIFSIYLNHRPDLIIMHCEICSFTGYYWQQIAHVEGLRRIIRFNQLPVRRTIFGQMGYRPMHHR